MGKNGKKNHKSPTLHSPLIRWYYIKRWPMDVSNYDDHDDKLHFGQMDCLEDVWPKALRDAC